MTLLPRIGQEGRPVGRIERVDLREGDGLQAAAPAIVGPIGDELTAVDAHGRRAGHKVHAVDVCRIKIDEAALERPTNGSGAGAGRRDPPALRLEGFARIRPDRDIDERMRLVADAEVRAGGEGKDGKEKDGQGNCIFRPAGVIASEAKQS